jgi:hypothetical protein
MNIIQNTRWSLYTFLLVELFVVNFNRCNAADFDREKSDAQEKHTKLIHNAVINTDPDIRWTEDKETRRQKEILAARKTKEYVREINTAIEALKGKDSLDHWQRHEITMLEQERDRLKHFHPFPK